MSISPTQITYNHILSFQYYDEYLNLIDDVYSAIRNKSQMDEERVWNDAEIMNNDACYQDYITRYPNGKYVSIAQSRIGKHLATKAPIDISINKCYLFQKNTRRIANETPSLYN